MIESLELEPFLKESLIQSSILSTLSQDRAGFIIGITHKQQCKFINIGQDITPDTILETGSITKIFTSLILAISVTNFNVDLFHSLSSSLNFPRRADINDVTLRDLATHTSGLPRLSLQWWSLIQRDPYKNYTQLDLYRDLNNHPLLRPKLSRFLYSNFGYAALGFALEKLRHTPYEELLQNDIFAPIGMKNSFLQFTGTINRTQTGYDRSGLPTSLWHWQAYAPCGALCSTANDLMHFIQFLISPSSDMSNAVDLALKPHYQLEQGHIGLGWMLTPNNDWAWHNGGTGGFASYVGFSRQLNFGILVLANQAANPEITKFGQALAKQLTRKGMEKPHEHSAS
jgi:serine-type D-Ala-D-Ala carboxypeptidase/endopeptidase